MLINPFTKRQKGISATEYCWSLKMEIDASLLSDVRAVMLSLVFLLVLSCCLVLPQLNLGMCKA